MHKVRLTLGMGKFKALMLIVCGRPAGINSSDVDKSRGHC